MSSIGPDLNLINVILSAIPILVLIGTILIFKWSGPKAGAVSWLAVVFIALVFFGSDIQLIALATSKGLSLSLFVLTIIWTSVILYNVIDEIGGIKVIGLTITRIVGDPLMQALIVGWAFSGFMQGIAGFGVPVAVVSPLLVLMGFSLARAASIVLIGHAWAVTFGSLGSSFFTIQLVTGIEDNIIGPHMAILFALPIILTGFAVAHLQGGIESIRRGFTVIIVMGFAMSISVWILATIGAPQIASIVPGLVGCAIGWILSKSPLLNKSKKSTKLAGQNSDIETNKSSTKLQNFHFAFLPYYLLLILSILSQIPTIKELSYTWHWGLDYPATETALGFSVSAVENYGKIRFLAHPAPLIIMSLIFTYLTLKFSRRWENGAMLRAIKKTYFQSSSTSVGVVTMVMMSLIMTDTGMTHLLSKTIADGTGPLFGLFTPFIGVLGTFVTGSNTNSNILFGALQIETARSLGLNTVTVASIQSIGGSLGSAIAPAKVLVGTTIVGLSGRENEVLKRTIPYCLGIVFLVGLQAWIILNLL